VTDYNNIQSRLCNKCQYAKYADGKYGCENKLKADAADALKALLKERTEMIEGAKKTAKVYAKFYEKYNELEEQMLKIKSRIYDFESMAKREYDVDNDNEYLEGYFDGLHQAAKLISTTPTIEER
jgi:hypothetical protein